MAILVLIIILAGLYLFAIKGRCGHKDISMLRSWYYAHRGLHGDGIPENSIAAFSAAIDAGYGIELDVHLMKDGNLAVIHDASLKRTAGADVKIEDMTAADLGGYHLEGTEERIPLFSDVLSLVKGNVPLIVELKSVDNNYASLCEAACELLEIYDGLYCMESFDPRCILWLRRNKNHILRGQLAYNLFRVDSKVPAIMKFCLRHNLANLFTRPDFVAYGYQDRRILSNFLSRRIWKTQGVTWTIRSQEDFATAVNEGWIPIFENIRP